MRGSSLGLLLVFGLWAVIFVFGYLIPMLMDKILSDDPRVNWFGVILFGFLAAVYWWGSS